MEKVLHRAGLKRMELEIFPDFTIGTTKKRQAKVNDRIRVEGKEGKIIELIEESDVVKILLDNGNVVKWDKGYVCLID